MPQSEIKAALNWPRRGLSVYQDVVLGGETVLKGRHACLARWQVIAPHLPAAGAILDVGSNFGWFGWKACETSPQRVVASMEADPHSARIQRRMLASHNHERIVLLTGRANAGAIRTFTQAGQQFEAALCLSVLHWMPDHEAFLRQLGQIARKLFVEVPDPHEEGAGHESIRRQIGRVDTYLRNLFPDRDCRRLARLPSHRDARCLREIWLVELPIATDAAPAVELDVAALMQLSVSWPPRSWWQRELAPLTSNSSGSPARPVVTPAGVRWQLPASGVSGVDLREIKWRTRALPEHRLQSAPQWCLRKAQGVGRRLLRMRDAVQAALPQLGPAAMLASVPGETP